VLVAACSAEKSEAHYHIGASLVFCCLISIPSPIMLWKQQVERGEYCLIRPFAGELRQIICYRVFAYLVVPNREGGKETAQAVPGGI
jgi:hypothetical protein